MTRNAVTRNAVTRNAVTRRTVAVYAALAGTVLATAAAAWQVTQGWARQRDAARRAARQHAASAGRALFDEIVRTSTELRVRLLLPVLSEPVDRPVSLAEFERHVETFLGMRLAEGDSLRGLFDVAPSSLGVRGALARDTAYRRVVLAAVESSIARGAAGDPALPMTAFPMYGGEQVVVVFALRRRADAGRGVMGMAFARTPVAFRREADDVLAHVSLVSSELSDLPVPAPPIAASRPRPPGPSAYVPNGSGGPRPPGNDRIAVRWSTPTRGALYQSADVPDEWWSGPRAVVGRFRPPGSGEWIDVAVQPAAVDALVAEAVPASQRALLLGVVALGALFAGATLVELRRQRRLAQARAYFVTAVSHELRTPLAQIRMFSELLAAGRTRSPEQATRWLGVINREAVRLGALVENVLLFGRGEAGGFQLAPREEDAASLARDVVAAFAPIADGRRATVRVEAPPDAPLWADADAVRQILGNLLDNAVKYGPEGQTVTVRVERRSPPISRRGGPLALGAVALLVDDEGPGVPPNDRERVWQPFTRLTPADTTSSGSGLGLGLVRELAVRQGGRAWVEEAPGGGARFGVLLPARPPHFDPRGRDAHHIV